MDAAMELELVIVGAGPAALAVLARLVRDCDEPALLSRVRVIDPSGEFCDAWRTKLASQGVDYLRSPTFVHPHPSRQVDDAVRAYGGAGSRLGELRHMEDVPNGWLQPSSRLFSDFCTSLAATTCAKDLSTCLLAASVQDILPVWAGTGRGETAPSYFELKVKLAGLGNEHTLHAKRVVLAVGDGATPRIPDWCAGLASGVPAGCLVHTTELVESQQGHANASEGGEADGGGTGGKPSEGVTRDGETKEGETRREEPQAATSDPKTAYGTWLLPGLAGGARRIAALANLSAASLARPAEGRPYLSCLLRLRNLLPSSGPPVPRIQVRNPTC